MLTGRGQLVLLVAAGLYLAAWGFGTREAYPVAVVLGVAPLLALLAVRRAAPPATLRRLVRGGRSEGDDLGVRVELPFAGRRPPRALTIHEEVPGGSVRVRLTRRGESLVGSYVVAGLPRGEYHLAGARLVREDPFGLADGSAPLGGEHVLLVRPRVVELGRHGADGGVLGFDGRRRELGRGSGFELHSVREYAQGDSLRRVHWRTTARRQKLMVKELEEAPRDEVVVLLDCAAGHDVGRAPDSSFEAQVRAAASVARACAGVGLRCAVATTGARTLRLRVSALDTAWEALLDALACVHDDGRRQLATALSDERLGLEAARLIIVTGALEPRTAEAIVARSRRGRASVVWVDPRTWTSERPETGPADVAAVELVRHGVELMRVRRGDDLARVLGDPAAPTAPLLEVVR